MTPSAVRALLARHGLAARADLGQNFLIDARLAAKLVGLAGVGAADVVLEIGTGLGILTRALAERAARVVTIEVDAGVVRALRSEKLLPENVELLHADALAIDLAALLRDAPAGARVVANLPYAISAPLLRRLLDLQGLLSSASVMLQREVAERLSAACGSPQYGSLAVLHAWCVRIACTLDVHPRCFHPVPRVRSRFLTLTPRFDAGLAPGELARLERVLRAGFAHRRKTLVNALRTAEPALVGSAVEAALAGLEISPLSRAEELDPERWLALARRLAEGLAGAEAPRGGA